MDRNVKWFSMPLGIQLSNIGSEVNRAIKYKRLGDDEKAANFCNKAIEFIEVIKLDPKNSHRTGEFDEAINELKDYFLGDNLFQTDASTLTNYYDAFLPY